MAFKIEFYPKAEIEYNDAFKWYEEQLEGLGVRFEFSIDRAINNITNNPLGYPNKKYDCHECNVGGFPFSIVYRLYSEIETILICLFFIQVEIQRKSIVFNSLPPHHRSI
ncbi:MAG TPA: hypothetical protein VNW51_06210 [Mucilaginibacter sp.]|jgi:hypothetical protein|nr:hypothetical protein [Mucilaginibacter sp.]